jgi:hypothetical protein
MSARTKFVLDVGLLSGAVLAFATGLVLLFDFHMGFGCLRREALGLSRLTWQNLHRLGAILTFATLMTHALANGRVIYQRILRLLRGNFVRHDVHELAVYTSNTIVLVTGFVAWLVVEGSMSILGPAPFGFVTGPRHAWIDAHHLVALLALILTTRHVLRRWHALSVLLGRARADTAGNAAT